MRRNFNRTEMLAAAIIRLFGIPHEHAKLMTAEQIISLVEADHYPIRHADGGTTHPSNCELRLISKHRHKTATVDVPQIAKGKRIRSAEEMHEFRRRILATREYLDIVPEHARPIQKRKIPSRPFPREQLRSLRRKP